MGSLLGQSAPAFSIVEAMSMTTFVTAVAAAGGAALILAFGVGAGFRIAKKGYAWVFGKM